VAANRTSFCSAKLFYQACVVSDEQNWGAATRCFVCTELLNFSIVKRNTDDTIVVSAYALTALDF